MREYTKNIYFIEKTQNIEGSYIEVKTLFVDEDKEKALDFYKKQVKNPKNSFGLILCEYKIKAEENYFYQLLKRWSQLPAEFYRKMNILNYRPLAEFHG
ncbi:MULTISPECIES: hypothetical protein [unclassified Enterococcus]|jgi:hypothetical protein|uniref:hypothetical protein n=1 Tax=unclassified Enterococcus TaxID=2608891 RepID=UPI0003545BA8|nr:hypothetical protein D920_01013 [Enterococcus faecalis 13-SD-W-01]